MSTLPSHNHRARGAFRGDDTPVDPVDETLVAYLDGELDEEERRRLEDQLIADAPLRQRLGELESGWQMLDHLPRPAITEEFARSTVEMIAAGASQALEIQRRSRPWRRLGYGLLLVATTLLLAAAGFAASQWLQDARFKAQLDDLPLAENLPAYLLDADLELMRQLADSRVWNEAMQMATDAGGLAVSESPALSEVSLLERAEMLRQLEPEARRDLLVHWNHLQQLSPERLDEVRRKAEAMRQLDRPEVVLRTMKEYALWLQLLAPETRDRIQEAKADEKLAVILAEVEKSARGWVRDYGAMFGENDRELIYEVLKLIARKRLDWAEEQNVWSHERLRHLAELRRRALQDASPQEFTVEEHLLLGMAITSRRFGRGDGRGESRNQPEAEDDPVAKLFQRPSPEEIEEIENVMSNKALAILNFYSPEERHEILWRWCIEIIFSKSPTSDTPEALLRRYLVLDPDDREVLDLKSPAEILHELAPRRRHHGPR